jgi:hypothetical protein
MFGLMEALMNIARVLRQSFICFALTTLVFASSQAHATPDDTMNIRFNPLVLIAGLVMVDFDIKVSDNWTVGPTLLGGGIKFSSTDSSGASDTVEVKASGFGARANYYFNGVFTDGWYLSPALQRQSISVDVSDATSSASAEVTGTVLTAVGGYHWFWDSFNLNLGAGFSSWSGPSKIHVVDSGGNTQDVDASTSRASGLAIDFMIGWTF